MKSLIASLCVAFPVLAFPVFAFPVLADSDLPALQDVAGVAATDVLNVRAEPNGTSAIVGVLPSGLTDIELLSRSEDGRWGQVRHGSTTGWASLRFLAPQDRPVWHALESNLRCTGTEPFWSLELDPADKVARLTKPDDTGSETDIAALWPGASWRPVAALSIAGEQGAIFVTLRGEACSDGMSDLPFAIRADVFHSAIADAPSMAWQGCCVLLP